MSIERISTIQTASVITQPTDATEHLTLIEKLEQERTRLNKQANDDIDAVSKENHAYQVGLIGGLTNAIKIVKQHQAESGWISVDEQLPHAEEMLTNHYDPKEFYEIILKTGELLIASYTHMKNDGNNEILFMDCTVVLKDSKWELLDAGFDGYQADEVSYWKPIKPPSEVQA